MEWDEDGDCCHHGIPFCEDCEDCAIEDEVDEAENREFDAEEAMYLEEENGRTISI